MCFRTEDKRVFVGLPEMFAVFIDGPYSKNKKKRIETGGLCYLLFNCMPKNYPKCPHNKHKSNCKKCSPHRFCSHGQNKQKSNCKTCSAHLYCYHEKKLYNCKFCGGKGICKHGKHRADCKKCSPHLYCKHEKKLYDCKFCDGKGICEHGKRRIDCVPCGGTNICKHSKFRYLCVACGGSQICQHKIRRRCCATCNPKSYQVNRIRHTVSGALHRRGIVKDKRTLELLGVDSWQQFELYWNSKIEVWNQKNPDDPITAQNAVTDHIKPVAAFKHFKHGNPNHHTNLQPIPGHLNGAKSDRWQQIDEDFWRLNIYENPGFMHIYIPHEMSPALADSFFGLEGEAS